MSSSIPGAPEAIEFSPAVVAETRARLRRLLGGIWGRIERDDDPARPEGARHLLAVLDSRAPLFLDDVQNARFPGRLPDFMALRLVVEVLERAQSEPAFGELLPTLAQRSDFRHGLLTFGFADRLRRYTPYLVQIPTRSLEGARTVDLIVGSGPYLYVETKSADEFDGPRRHVSYGHAQHAIKAAWRSAYGGEPPQVPPEVPSALLVGGVTVELGSMPAVQRAARDWLARRGDSRPNCWGIIAMTFLTTSRLPQGRRIGDGAPIEVTAGATPFLVTARNPAYEGSVKIVLTPPVW